MLKTSATRQISLPAGARPTHHPSVRWRRIRRNATPYLLLLPTILMVGLVLVYPMASTFHRSFYRWPFGSPSELGFVGLENYKVILKDSENFLQALSFTGIFTVGSLVLEFSVAFLGALLLDRVKRGRAILTSIVIAPYMVAPIAVGLVWGLILSRDTGVVNYVLSLLGISPINWLSSTGPAMLSTILAETWKSAPFAMLILLAGLVSIPDDVIEAGRMDGASGTQRFRYIILPLLRPSIAVALIFSTIFKLRVFDLVLSLTGGGPGVDTTPLGLLIQKMFFRYFAGGEASAVSVVLLVFGGLISILYLRFVYREVTY